MNHGFQWDNDINWPLRLKLPTSYIIILTYNYNHTQLQFSKNHLRLSYKIMELGEAYHLAIFSNKTTLLRIKEQLLVCY